MPGGILVAALNPRDVAAKDAVLGAAIATIRHIYRPLPGKPAAQAPSHCLVAWISGRIVGTISYRFEEDRIHLFRLGVDPAIRRQGVCRALVAAVEGIGSEATSRCVSLFTIRETGNVAIFAALGFTQVREEPAEWVASDLHAQLHEAYMEKALPRMGRSG